MENLIQLDLRPIFESLPGLYLILSQDLTIVAVSEAYLKATMTERQAIEGRGIFEVFPDNPDDPLATGESNLRASLQHVLQKGTIHKMAIQKYDIRKPDGTFVERYWSPQNLPVFDGNHQVAHIIHCVEDVTEFLLGREEMEKQRLESETLLEQIEVKEAKILRHAQKIRLINDQLKVEIAERKKEETKFKSLLESSPDALIIVNEEGVIKIANNRCEVIFGYEKEELQGQPVEILIPMVKRAGHKGRRNSFFKHAKVRPMGIGLDLLALRKDGTEFPVEISLSPIAAEGNILVSAAIRDITERKKAEQQISYLARLVESTSEAVYSVTPDFHIRTWNKGAENLYGYKANEAVGKPVFDIVRSHLPEKKRLEIREQIRKLGQWEDELEHIRKEGSTIYVMASVTATRNSQNEIDGYVSVARDITDRKSAEMALNELNAELEQRVKQRTAELERSQKRLQTILQTEPECVKLLGANCELLEMNPSGLAMIEADSIEQVLGQSVLDCVSERHRDSFQELTTNVFRGKSGRLEFESIGFKGTHRWLETHAVPLKDEEGKIISLLGVTRDVTERKTADQKIRELNENLEKKIEERTKQWQAANQELEAFTYSVSHDLRAPLRSIDGYARILEEDFADKLSDDGKRVIATITRNANRMNRLINNMLDLSRFDKTALSLSVVNMNDVVSMIMAELITPDRVNQIQVRVGQLQSSRADMNMIHQVWTNYISNAIKYTGKKAEAIIEVGCAGNSNEVVYFVKDNGIGFDQQYAHKLFAVFQRLHKQNEFDGTGVGLAICQRIITRHGGRVWAEGEPNAGATFYFSLPNP